MTKPYQFDEHGIGQLTVNHMDLEGYEIRRPAGLPDDLWKQHAKRICDLLNTPTRLVIDMSGGVRQCWSERPAEVLMVNGDEDVVTTEDANLIRYGGGGMCDVVELDVELDDCGEGIVDGYFKQER